MGSSTLRPADASNIVALGCILTRICVALGVQHTCSCSPRVWTTSPLMKYLLGKQVPEGVDFQAVIANAMSLYNLEISGGLGPSIGKVWRIGIMGELVANPMLCRCFRNSGLQLPAAYGSCRALPCAALAVYRAVP